MKVHDLGMTMKIPVILYVFTILANINDFIPIINIGLTFNNTVNIVLSVILIIIVAALAIFSRTACCIRGNEQ